jgi:type II secretory pathway pseudopilin PulG
MKKAFTLIELLVYIAIMSFIIIVAGRAFSDSTSMRVRTQNMTKATEEANNMAAILKEDILQMGTKSWRDNNSDKFLVAEKVYYSLPTDSSSYELTKNGNFHKFIFHKVHYKDDGICGAVLKITWGVNATDSLLYRKCEQINDAKCPKPPEISKDDCPDSLAMATGVEVFTLLPSKPVSPDILFPPTGQTFKLIDRGNDGSVKQLSSPITYEGNAAIIRGFAVNANSTDKNLNRIFVGKTPTYNNYTDCHKFDFQKDIVYAIQFKTPISKNEKNVPDDMAFFKPGKDHLAMSLINSADWKKVPNTTDFIFWSPQTTDSDEQNHYMEFSIPANVNLPKPSSNICVAFEFSFYQSSNSFAHNGTLKIEDFQVMKKNDKGYSFDDSYVHQTEDKKNVKAFRLKLQIKRKSETGRIEMVIPTPNNGIKAEGS